MLADRMRLTAGGFPQGAVALLHFDNDLNDVVQNLAWTPSGTAGYDTGKFSLALNTASDGYVNSGFTNSIDFAQRDFTISFWIYPTDFTSKQIVNKANFQLSPDSTYRSLSAGLINGNGILQFYIWGGLGVNGVLQRSVSNPTALTLNAFSFIKIGRKGTELFLIVNGVKQSITIESNFKVNTTAQALTFCGAISGSNNGFVGRMDELLIQMDFGDNSLIVPTSPY